MAAPTGCAASGRRGVEDAAPYGWYGVGPGFVILSAAKDPYPTGRWTEFASGKSHSSRMPGGQWPPLRRYRVETRGASRTPPPTAVRHRNGGGQSLPIKGTGGRPTQTCSLFPVPCSLFPVPCSLFPVPCSLFPVPCSPFPVPSSPIAYCLMPIAYTCHLSLVTCSSGVPYRARTARVMPELSSFSSTISKPARRRMLQTDSAWPRPNSRAR